MEKYVLVPFEKFDRLKKLSGRQDDQQREEREDTSKKKNKKLTLFPPGLREKKQKKDIDWISY